MLKFGNTSSPPQAIGGKYELGQKRHLGSILFVFARPAAKRLYEVRHGLLPRTLCYSYEVLRSEGVCCSWSDAGHKRPKLSFWFNRLFSIITRGTGIGFNLFQSIILIPKFRRASIVFATVDSVALPTLLLKQLMIFRAPVVYQTVGLTAGLSEGKVSIWQICVLRWLASAAALIIATPAESDILEKRLKVPKSKLLLCFGGSGVDIPFFDKIRNERGNGSFVLSVGRDAQRDFEIICDVALILPDIRFVIIASASNAPSKHIPNNVIIKCEVPYQQVLKYYRDCSFMVNPVTDNPYTFGWVVVGEAMAMGKTVVISKISALKGLDFFRSWENCVLVPPGDVAALANVVRILWDNPEEIKRLGEGGRMLAENYLHMDRYTALLRSAFETLSYRYQQSVSQLTDGVQ